GRASFQHATGIPGSCRNLAASFSTSGVFVATTGSDAALGTMLAPLQTLPAAIALAESIAARDVYLAQGTYLGPVVIAVSIPLTLHGGYAANFSQRDLSLFTSVIEGNPGAIEAQSVTNLEIEGLTLRGLAATT